MEALLDLPWSAWAVISIGFGIMWTALILQKLTGWGVVLFPFLWPFFVAVWLFAGFMSAAMMLMAYVVKGLSWLIFAKPIVVQVPAHKKGEENDNA